MKTFLHVWQYLAKFFLEWQIFHTKAVEKIKTHFMFCNFFFFRKSCHLWDNVGKIWWSQRDHKWRHNMAHTSCMLKKQDYVYTRVRARTHTHTIYIIFIAFPRQQWFANGAQCYVICTLSVLLTWSLYLMDRFRYVGAVNIFEVRVKSVLWYGIKLWL